MTAQQICSTIRLDLSRLAETSRALGDAWSAQQLAERDFLAHVVADHTAHPLTLGELAQLYQAYRAVATPGYAKRWNAAMPISHVRIWAHVRAQQASTSTP